MAAGDLDGDGKIEVAVTTTNTADDGAQVFVFSPNGKLFQPAGTSFPAWPRYNTAKGVGGDADTNGQGQNGYGCFGLNVGIAQGDAETPAEELVRSARRAVARTRSLGRGAVNLGKALLNVTSAARPLTERPGLDFSFSGLKTAVVVALRNHGPLDDQSRADAARGFEEAVVDTLVIKCRRALEHAGARTLVVAGGVGANRRLRARMLAMGERDGVRVVYPRAEFCTDNAAMIALLGHLRLAAGQADDLAIRARARWPMTELAPPSPGQRS